MNANDPMTEHPMQPSQEQIREWAASVMVGYHIPPAWFIEIVNQAYAAGADAELDACEEWLPSDLFIDKQSLREVRRPEPLSMKEKALEALEQINGYAVDQMRAYVVHGDLVKCVNTIREALEGLPE